MNKPNILLIGAGQLGSRHLQALGNIERELKISVVDPGEASLNVSRERYDEIGEAGKKHEVGFYSSLDAIKNDVDVCVIATSSNVRAMVTKDLLSRVVVKNIVFEKVLFQKISDYSEISELLKEKNVNAWVNCPRRMFPIYEDLRANLRKSGSSIHFSVSGGEWGLASNAIHFIDLAADLANDPNYTIDVSALDEGFVPCKRDGFIEISGTIRGRFSNGSTFSLQSLRGGAPIHKVTVVTENNIHMIDEINLQYYRSAVGEGEDREKAISFPFQSQLTNVVVESILDNGDCPLTKFADSCGVHEPFVKSLVEFSNKENGTDSDYCSIT